jgi:hypothetical protein
MIRKLIPMLFSTDMAKANMDGNKTETRRIVKPQPESINNEKPIPMTKFLENLKELDKKGLKVVKSGTGGHVFPKCPYGKPGDVLWIRETYCKTESGIHYAASVCNPKYDKPDSGWKPSIHMPLAACRYFAEITSIRVERLQNITEEAAIAEGVSRYPRSPIYGYKKYGYEFDYVLTAKESYQTLWESINSKGSWELNPWVWVVQYRRIGAKQLAAYWPQIAESYKPEMREKIALALKATTKRMPLNITVEGGKNEN